jgi:hypothetical protein
MASRAAFPQVIFARCKLLGYAILTATIVEEQLEMLLLAHLHLDEEGVAAWFGDYKPYSSFARKIRGAYDRYGLINEETRLRSHAQAPRLQGSTDKDAGGGAQRAP